MIRALHLPPGVRRRLKSPLGKLLDNSTPEEDLKELLSGRVVYSVGDKVSLRLLRLSLCPQVAIFDWKTKREPSPHALELKERLVEAGYTFLRCKNPPGGITEDAFGRVLEAIESGRRGERVALEVEGEEDLLALLFIRYGGEGSIVVYGQPAEGIVVVEVDSVTVKNIEALLRQMEADRNEN